MSLTRHTDDAFGPLEPTLVAASLQALRKAFTEDTKSDCPRDKLVKLMALCSGDVQVRELLSGVQKLTQRDPTKLGSSRQSSLCSSV